MDEQTKTMRLFDAYPNLARDFARKLHIKKDEIPLIQKYFVAETKEADISWDERSIVSRISCVKTDRDGESLLPDGVKLENYRKNPIVCFGHSYGDIQNIVGKNLWIKADDDGLIAKTVFAKSEYADQVFRAYTEDIAGTGPLLRGWSVGFIPIKWEEPKQETKGSPKRIFTEWELLEYSAVPIPCSPESLTLAYQKGIIKNESLMADFGIEAETTLETKQAEPPIVQAEAMEAKVETKDAEPISNPPEIEGVEGRKDAEPDTPVAPPDYLEILARLDDLSRKVDALATPPAPVPSPAPAREDVIDIDREDEIDIADGQDIDIDSIATPPAPKLSAQPAAGVKSIPAETIEAAISQAVNRLNLKAIVAEAVDLSIARLRGKVK